MKTMLPDYKRNVSRKLISAELSDEARIRSRSRFTVFLVLSEERDQTMAKSSPWTAPLETFLDLFHG